MKVVGITGGIASGKSEVERILAQHHPVIDADQTSRQVVAPGSRGLAMVVDAFGKDILQADGALDRAALRTLIASDKTAQQRLNAILHPLIGQTIMGELAQLAAAGTPLAFVSAALMLESGSYKRYDRILLICAPQETRLQRLIARDGMDEELARALMGKQWADDKRRPYAQHIIENDGDLEALRRTTAHLEAELRAWATNAS